MDKGKSSMGKKIYIKNSKRRRWFYGITSIVCIISTFFCVKAFFQPLQIEKKIQENMINQNINFDYKVEVEPNTLYPEGGIISAQEVMPAKIMKNMEIEFDSQISSQKDVEIKGELHPTYMISGENQWEREFTIGKKATIAKENTKTHQVGQKLSIPISSVMKFINQVEEETSIFSDNYFLTIRPNFKGEILYQGTEIPLDTSSELIFSVKNRQIELVGEKTFEIETPIEVSSRITQTYTWLGMDISIMALRILLGLVSLLSLASILIMKIEGNKEKGSNKGEGQLIDKKYKDKIIGVGKKIDLQSKMTIAMEAFKDLYHIAEEREQIILRVRSQENTSTYYVLDGDFAYYYQSKYMEKSKDYPVMTEGV